MPIPYPVTKAASLLAGHIYDWGWVVAGWFRPEARRQRQIHRLLFQIGEIRRDLMRRPKNPQYETLLSKADKFAAAVMDFHNMDVSVGPAIPMPPEVAGVPPEAGHNTREGHTAMGFWLEWHRKQLLYKRG